MVQLIIWFSRFAKYFLVLWIVTILIVSSIPSLPALKIHTSKSEIRLDYMIHLIEYGILGFLAFLTFSGKEYCPGYRRFFIITVSLLLFAFLDEFHQKFIPGRAFNVKDLYSDAAGIVLALIFCVTLFRKLPAKIGKGGQNRW
jgi:VanZ family protein